MIKQQCTGRPSDIICHVSVTGKDLRKNLNFIPPIGLEISNFLLFLGLGISEGSGGELGSSDWILVTCSCGGDGAERVSERKN